MNEASPTLHLRIDDLNKNIMINTTYEYINLGIIQVHFDGAMKLIIKILMCNCPKFHHIKTEQHRHVELRSAIILCIILYFSYYYNSLLIISYICSLFGCTYINFFLSFPNRVTIILQLGLNKSNYITYKYEQTLNCYHYKHISCSSRYCFHMIRLTISH